MAQSTPGCNAVNAQTGRGPCALRACGCPAPLPVGAMAAFTAYRRLDSPCPPPPPPPPPVQGFAHVFTSSMVLQRVPAQPRLFGTAAPDASLLVELVKVGGAGVTIAAVAVRADAAGEWACLLPSIPAGGPYNLTLSISATAPSPTRVLQTLSDVLVGDVIVCSGQSNMQEPVSVVNNASAELAAAAAYPWWAALISAPSQSTTSVSPTPNPQSGG